MSEGHFDTASAERAALRSAVAAVDKFIVHLPSTGSGVDQGLAASWASLVKLMALGTAPLLRDCPHCGNTGMRAATLCSRCWARLSELGPVVDEKQAAGGNAES